MADPFAYGMFDAESEPGVSPKQPERVIEEIQPRACRNARLHSDLAIA